MNGLLFIDDEEGIRRSIIRALRDEPYRVYTAGNGAAGMTVLRENLPYIDMVISDYKMPGRNGIETLAEIGTLHPEITKIILTGYATMEAAIQAIDNGVDGFLTKPFDNVELRAKIHEISVRKLLRQFVPEQVYKEMTAHKGSLRNKYHQVSVLFSDIRGFTRMSQDISPEALADFLNYRYFTPMGEIAYQHNGTTDKHIGDSMMVVYGSPVNHVDDALMAVRSAVAMQEKAREIDTRLVRKNGLRLRIGIGISTGKVFSGVLGSLRKKEFTSIGMAVNIAARLQSIAQQEEILITRETLESTAGGISAERLHPVYVKGLDEPIEVYRVKG
ncbi:MAG: response regulator [Deltaproteobacteria bacterium]|nr:response regulator [Deltaproteobacteria bacterium]MBW2178624.1 response regulator [Deltaproteobacteria bacterium]MBW2633397.1 response regulator [Deltaproteobacteria bacterium]MBW2677839.1 response regulator [Deltaproteobacteria bacterium]